MNAGDTREITTRSGKVYTQRAIVARFPGHCARCGGQISIGDLIWYNSHVYVSHVECPEQPAVVEMPKAPARQIRRRCPDCGGDDCPATHCLSHAPEPPRAVR